MLYFLPGPLRGIIALILHSLTLVVLSLSVIMVALLRLLIPIPPLRRSISWFLHETFPFWWVDIINFITWLTTKIQWDVQGAGKLQHDGWYFVICNHLSGVDILVLEKIFIHKIPMIKFFMKRELLWMLPFGGLACWLMGFPFMTRYSKEYLRKHPEKKGKDVEITRRACEKFKHQPIAIMNFLEGTRYTPQKQQAQHSPYKHLLKPKAGGFAFVLATLNDYVHHLIDVTIVYPEGKTSLWKFICGNVKKIIVRYEVLPITENLHGDYYNDPAFRHHFQQWLNQCWQKKDALIEQILQSQKTNSVTA
jgi:1-acyl-sn-glycerol-3-phosphate acyltransferase